MRWYGFALIFLASVVFSNLLVTVRFEGLQTSLTVEENSLPAESLKISGRSDESVLSAETMPKQPLILFFFASWCRPCQFEAPVIAKLSERHDVPFIGVAVRDDPRKLEQFLSKTNNPFQFVALDPEMKWAGVMRAENLPTAFILNGKSEAVARINGILTEEFYFQKILPFIRELKNDTAL